MKRTYIAIILFLCTSLALAGEKPKLDSVITVPRAAMIENWRQSANSIGDQIFRSLTREQRELLDRQKLLTAYISAYELLSDSTVTIKRKQ